MKKNKPKIALRNRGIYKLLLLMKFTIAFVLLASLQVSAKTYSQDRITLKLQSAELKTALKQIEKKSIFRFLYNDEVVSAGQKIDVDATNSLVTDVLDDILKSTTLTYKVLNNNLVVITQKNFVLQEVKVSGRVTTATGEPIPGVTVKIKGSAVGTSTDGAGNYSLSTPDGATLVFSSVGYTSAEIKVDGRTEINVVLQNSTKTIDEVVVIGYGTASKRDLTGSIAKVSGKEIADKPNTNPVASLQAKVAGLSVVNTAVPGGEPDIRIRGTISIGSVHPLYVVDGIFNDNINYLNPNDIESIEILKDPSSLAIFGVKGAAGVIAITTKRAKAGQVIVNYNTTYGAKKLVDKIKYANGDEFRSILAMEGKNQFFDDGSTVINDFVTNGMSKFSGNTDWIDALTRTAHTMTHNLSVLASSDKNKFFMGIGYAKDEGLVKHVKYEKMTLNIADEYKLNKAIKVGFNINATRAYSPYDGNGALNEARKIFPIVESGTKTFFTRNPYGPVTDSANFNLYSGLPVLQNSLANPLMVLENAYDKRKSFENRLVGSVFGELNFLKNFNFRTTLYADVSTVNTRVYNPLYDAWDPGASGANQIFHYSTLTNVNQDVDDYRKYQTDFILNYKKRIGDHSFTATGGFTTYYSGVFSLHGQISQKAGDAPIPNDPRFWYLSTGFGDQTTLRANNDPSKRYQHEYTTVSGLARILYNYKNKYYFNASYRKDYASQINSDFSKQGQNFWAVGAAWELTREKFMDNQKIFNFLKLKGSIGVLGNANTLGNDYPAYPNISPNASAVFGENIASAYNLNYLFDPNTHWETVHAKEVGIEFTALQNRLHGEINYYNKLTKDILVLLKPVGVLPTLTNNGEISNSGFEFSAGWTQKVSKDLVVSLSGNLTTYKNKVVSIGVEQLADPQYPNQVIAGQPIGYFYGYVVEGLYQSYADILKSPVSNVNGGGAQPGDFKYKDINGDGKVDDQDRTNIGNPTPDFSYGVSLNVTWKNFDLGVDLGGVYGNEIYRYWATSEQKNGVYNYPQYAVNSWNGPGTSNWIPIADAKHLINRAPSTFGIEDGSYIRLRNVQLGYNFNQSMLAKAHIKNIKLYLNVQNLKTWKRNLGYSPEYGGTATSFGIDGGAADNALPRIITGGLNVTF